MTGKGEDLKALVNLIPSEGSVKLGVVARRLKYGKKHAETLVKELRKERLIRIKHHFLRDSELMATPLLIEHREVEKLKKQVIMSKKENTFKKIVTPVDYLYEIVRDKKEITTHEVGAILNIPEKVVERWAKTLSKLVSVEYPINVLSKPIIKIKKSGKSENKEAGKEKPHFPSAEVLKGGRVKLLESYEINADKVPALVKLLSSNDEPMPLYMVELPEIGDATIELLKSVIERLTDKIEIQAEDITDPKRMVALKDRFFSDARKLLKEEIPLSNEAVDILAGVILHNAYGLGDVEILMSDDFLEEVCVNTSHVPLTVYHKKYGWMKTNLLLDNEKAIYNYAAQIGRKVERNITNLDPIMDAHLLSGDRVCASLFPISSFGNTITIRKFSRSPWTITHFISPERFTFSKEICAFLWLCFQYELNIIVSGGTASGKTSVLNCLCSLIQPTHRVVSIEDTREINLPRYLYWNWIPLTTREKNPEGKGEVSMLDLIVTSLRMRPDRIIVGEIRRKREAEVLFEAMHTGHSVYSTLHADTARNLKRRLLEPPIELPPAEIEALHLIVIQHRDRTTGTRKTFEVAEIIPGAEGKEFDLNYLFRWNSRTQEFAKINESIRVYDELNLHAGMSKDEIEKDLKEKESVLQWMLDNKIYDINAVGDVMDRYYKNPKSLLREIRNEVEGNKK
jgi:flagellar protein FlaI